MAFKNMNHRERRAVEKHLRTENAKYSDELVEVILPESKEKDANRISAYRSRKFLVQIFEENGMFRLSVNRTIINARGEWAEGISWDELQEIKSAVGFADFDAVEVFPATEDEVNVANMRHLWVMPEKLAFAWRKDK